MKMRDERVRKKSAGAYRTTRRLGVALLLALGASLAGCATYRPLPLPKTASLAPGLGALDLSLPPATPGDPPRRVDIRRPLSLDEIGLLAILNDPDLKSERGEMELARAGVTQASTLPNPSVGLGFAALLGGPGTADAYTASISQNIAAILTYRPRVEAAKAEAGAIDAGLLWREWQVAQKARLLALDLSAGEHSIALTVQARDLVSDMVRKAEAATRSGDLDLAALSPLLAAKVQVETSLAALRLEDLKNWQALDALLGLEPGVRFAIAAAPPAALPHDLDALTASLPGRRPDLVALQLGYRSADEKVRAAILGQFPAFILGGTWNSDTSQVRSAGPNVTFDLPIFDRNQGPIASSRATRRVLHAQYQARLDQAIGTVQALAARLAQISADLASARDAAAAADRLARTASAAYRAGNLDQRAWTDYETTALARRLEIVSLRRSRDEARVLLTLELGIGLPPARILPAEGKSRS